MSVSAYGVIFIPVALWILIFRSQYLVPLLLVSSVLVAAPIVDVSLGGFDL